MLHDTLSAELDSIIPFEGKPPTPAQTRAAALARFEGMTAFFPRIAPLFRQVAIDQASALTEAAEGRDSAKIAHWAHTLKGSLLTVGANDSAALAARIEAQAQTARAQDLLGLSRRLAAEVAIIAANLGLDPV